MSNLYDPLASYKVTGTWADHVGTPPGTGYSAGGIDWGVSYGTAVPAPADGTISNRAWWGSAGNTVTLTLDESVPHPSDRNLDLVAIQFLHLSVFMPEGHYGRAQTIAMSGASANGSLWGGEVHVHGHGLRRNGTRVDYRTYITGNPSTSQEFDMPKVISVPNGTIAFVSDTYGRKYTDPNDFSLAANRWAYGEVTGLTEDVVTTLVNEANYRGALQVDAIAARVTAKAVDLDALAKKIVSGLPVGGAAPTAAEVAAAVGDVLAKRLVS